MCEAQVLTHVYCFTVHFGRLRRKETPLSDATGDYPKTGYIVSLAIYFITDARINAYASGGILVGAPAANRTAAALA